MFIDATTYRTSARGVSGVNQFYDHTGKACLVLNKAPELVKSPRVMLPPLALANRGPVPDARENLKGNTATGVFSLCNNSLAKHMVGISSKACLFMTALVEKSLGCLRAIGLELLAQFGMALSQTVHLAARVGLAVRICGDIDDTKVNTKKALGVIGLRLQDIHHNSQVKGAVSQCKVSLPYNPVYPGFLIGTDAHWNELPSLEGKDRYPICPLPGKDALVVDYSAMGLEGVDPGLIPAVALNDLSHYSDCHLCRKLIMLSKVAIGKMVEFHLRSRIAFEGKIGDIVARLIEAFHSLQQGLMLFGGRCKFDHQCLFHAFIIDNECQYIKGGKPTFLCRLKTTVSCGYFL